jgi:uncharacterized lipoprotein NlpE involved in copper resistance
MKFSINVFGFAAIIFVSCTSNTTDKNITKDTVILKVPNQETPAFATEDNSSNSLDWEGTYTGIVPCADCEGIETTITIKKDLSYTVQTKYLGKKDAALSERKGLFSWNKDGNKITLSDIKNTPAQYLVGENKLIQLDMQGNRITGESAGKYELIKK